MRLLRPPLDPPLLHYCNATPITQTVLHGIIQVHIPLLCMPVRLWDAQRATSSISHDTCITQLHQNTWDGLKLCQMFYVTCAEHEWRDHPSLLDWTAIIHHHIPSSACWRFHLEKVHQLLHVISWLLILLPADGEGQDKANFTREYKSNWCGEISNFNTQKCEIKFYYMVYALVR